MTMSHEKAQGAAKVLYAIFSFFYWVCVILMIGGTVAFVASFFIPDSFFVLGEEMDSLGFTFDNTIYFDVNSKLLGSLTIRPLIQMFIPLALVLTGMLAIGIKQIQLILKTVKEGNPFAGGNANSLTIVGIDLLIASLMVNVTEILTVNRVVELLEIENIHMNFSLNASFLIAGILVLILAGIFRYGSFLKSEYDATV